MSDGTASHVANDSQEKHDDAGEPSDAIASAEASPSPPPDGGYGWVCLLACFCVNAFTWGIVAVCPPIPIFHSYIREANPSITLTTYTIH